MTPTSNERELAEVKETMIELHLTLKRLIEDVKVVPDLEKRIAMLQVIAKKAEELYDLIYIGGAQEPLATRVRSNTKGLEWARRAIKDLEKQDSSRSIGPKERVAIYALIAGAIGTAVKAWMATH